MLPSATSATWGCCISGNLWWLMLPDAILQPDDPGFLSKFQIPDLGMLALWVKGTSLPSLCKIQINKWTNDFDKNVHHCYLISESPMFLDKLPFHSSSVYHDIFYIAILWFFKNKFEQTNPTSLRFFINIWFHQRERAVTKTLQNNNKKGSYCEKNQVHQ